MITGDQAGEQGNEPGCCDLADRSTSTNDFRSVLHVNMWTNKGKYERLAEAGLSFLFLTKDRCQKLTSSKVDGVGAVGSFSEERGEVVAMSEAWILRCGVESYGSVTGHGYCSMTHHMRENGLNRQ